MLELSKYHIPNNVYPLDVTSPGPDQRPGVARSQRSELLEPLKVPFPPRFRPKKVGWSNEQCNSKRTLRDHIDVPIGMIL